MTLNRKIPTLGVSAGFLVTYVIYHWFKEGPRPYLGAYKGLYLSIPASHIVLAIAVVQRAQLLRGFADHLSWIRCERDAAVELLDDAREDVPAHLDRPFCLLCRSRSELVAAHDLLVAVRLVALGR